MTGKFTAFSYGVFTWDTWGEHMSSNYNIKPYLYDCFETTPLKNKWKYSINIRNKRGKYEMTSVFRADKRCRDLI